MTRSMAFMNKENVLNFYHTARHLSFSQIFYQVKSRVIKSRVDLIDPVRLGLNYKLKTSFDPERGFISRWTGGEFDVGELRFEFINEIGIYTHGVNWNEDRFGGLWLDHLHYFRYLELLSNNREEVQAGYRLISDWKSQRLNVTKAFWPAYNASERAFCMGRWLLINRPYLDPEQCEYLLNIIYQDIDFVNRNMEWNLNGNHLLKNIAAVWWGCYLFDEQYTVKWRATIDKHLKDIVKNQILSDGLHYEKSPLYHQLALIDFLDILMLMPAGSTAFIYLSELVEKMYSAFKLFIHPDGKSCLFGDSSANLSAPANAVLDFCNTLLSDNRVAAELPDGGYFQLSTDYEFYIVADAGNLGPDEQMGHAHSDMLHFEMSYLGQRVLVEGGTSSYYHEVRRPYERSTQAHNTVSINGDSQCQNWSNFRVAQRGYCRVTHYSKNNNESVLEAQHDGFKRIYGVIHRRKFSYRTGVFIIDDNFDFESSLRSDNVNAIDSFLHFSKECQLRIINEQLVLIEMSSGAKLYLSVENASIKIVPMQYGVGYNVLEAGNCLNMKVLDIADGVRYCFVDSLLKLTELTNVSA